jgi:cobalamin biosynthesis protein CobT
MRVSFSFCSSKVLLFAFLLFGALTFVHAQDTGTTDGTSVDSGVNTGGDTSDEPDDNDLIAEEPVYDNGDSDSDTDEEDNDSEGEGTSENPDEEQPVSENSDDLDTSENEVVLDAPDNESDDSGQESAAENKGEQAKNKEGKREYSLQKRNERATRFVRKCIEKGGEEDVCREREENTRKGLREFNRKKKTIFVKNILSAKRECVANHKGDRKSIRKCFRSSLREDIVSGIKKMRVLRKECRKNNPGSVPREVKLCALEAFLK